MHRDRAPSVTVRRRPLIVLVGLCIVLMGLAARFGIAGWRGDAAGGVLYAVLVYLLVAFAGPRVRPLVVGAVALGLCCAVEVLQLTSVPGGLAAVLPPVRLVLGSTFVAWDLVAYALGAAAAGVVDHRIQARTRNPAAGEPHHRGDGR